MVGKAGKWPNKVLGQQVHLLRDFFKRVLLPREFLKNETSAFGKVAFIASDAGSSCQNALVSVKIGCHDFGYLIADHCFWQFLKLVCPGKFNLLANAFWRIHKCYPVMLLRTDPKRESICTFRRSFMIFSLINFVSRYGIVKLKLHKENTWHVFGVCLDFRNTYILVHSIVVLFLDQASTSTFL